MKTMTIYLAGPISGKGYDEVVDKYKEVSPILIHMGYKVLCPMVGKKHLRNETDFQAHGFKYPVSSNHAIFERDKWMVDQCDIVLCDLSPSGDRVSIGSIMELAWASMLGKHTLVVMQEGNIHRHAFVIEAADIVFEVRDDALKYLNDFEQGVKGL